MGTRVVSLREEFANAVTHGVGLVLSLIGMPILILAAMNHGERATVIGASVFGATLIALYSASTLYHAIPHPTLKQKLRVVDHSAIYLLIAGTYTPFTLGVLRGTWGWTLFGIVWTLAALGVLFKVVFGSGAMAKLSTAIYVAMGWVIIIAIKPLMASMEHAGLMLLVAGGLCYTGGVIFYVDRRRAWTHPVWHLFVMGGSICHYFAVLWYAAPAR
ncbi:PAQR family membrane homeostasis protein TrhA [Gemmatimonas groenlandica]|uniref:Hemolysin III family protein n=1 Tax=Gemmatimonas groenlandica TaxID=2732249 RepID=A0A6M4ISN0_9BACT|nr:hemolysin III family protein [Gemmatimonas groenlandica]QJR37088.1 hemolysin III family protein [Gemmatimonas groenlandica]